jgi:hypothetical protein
VPSFAGLAEVSRMTGHANYRITLDMYAGP